MRLISPDFLSFVPTVLLQVAEERTVTPAFAGTGVLLLLVLTGLLLVLILREKVKDRSRQAPPVPADFNRQATPLPTRRSSRGGPPELPRRH